MVAAMAGLLADPWADPLVDSWVVSTAGLLAGPWADEMVAPSVDRKVVRWADH